MLHCFVKNIITVDKIRKLNVLPKQNKMSYFFWENHFQ